MSVKHAMLALLSAQPSSTYQLRKRFDASTGQGLPLNIGQVSTTLQRLERDGLVIRDDGPAGDPTGQPWRLTAAGHEELAGWWASPVVADQRGRDELVMKLMLSTIVPGVDIAALIQDQRAATQRGMHDLSRLRRNTLEDDLIGRLIIDRHLFLAEAELRWLDDVEAALIRASRNRRRESIRDGKSGPTTHETAAEFATHQATLTTTGSHTSEEMQR